MPSESDRRHLFISHHHWDDGHVTKLTSFSSRDGYDIRNSSIRAKPANQRRLVQNNVSDEAIKRLLRMKISWPSTVVVLIGKHTHSRPWVTREIEQANRVGRRIGLFWLSRGRLKDSIGFKNAWDKTLYLHERK